MIAGRTNSRAATCPPRCTASAYSSGSAQPQPSSKRTSRPTLPCTRSTVDCRISRPCRKAGEARSEVHKGHRCNLGCREKARQPCTARTCAVMSSARGLA